MGILLPLRLRSCQCVRRSKDVYGVGDAIAGRLPGQARDAKRGAAVLFYGRRAG